MQAKLARHLTPRLNAALDYADNQQAVLHIATQGNGLNKQKTFSKDMLPHNTSERYLHSS
jgi:hypothetical protein